MNIVSAPEVRKIRLDYIDEFKISELYKELKKLEIGQALQFTFAEFPFIFPPTGPFINRLMHKTNNSERFTFKCIQKGKEYMFIRTV